MSSKRVIHSIVIAGLVAAALQASPLRAQQNACTYFKVSAGALNVFRKPLGDADFVAQLRKDDIVCVTGDQQSEGRAWAHIASATSGNGAPRPMDGWTIMSSLQPATRAEIAALQSAPVSPPPAPAAPAAPPAAPQAAAPPPTQPAPPAPNTTFGQAVITFSTPITEGPVPVNGSSLEQLVAGIPVYPPIEGLPDTVWKKHCSNCHNWNRQTLCDQAKIYVKNPKMTMRIQHPYGGPEKIAMLKWAQGGCQ